MASRKRKRSNSNMYSVLIKFIHPDYHGMAEQNVLQLFENVKSEDTTLEQAISECIAELEMKEQTLIRTGSCFVGEILINERSMVRKLITLLRSSLTELREFNELYDIEEESHVKHQRVSIGFALGQLKM